MGKGISQAQPTSSSGYKVCGTDGNLGVIQTLQSKLHYIMTLLYYFLSCEIRILPVDIQDKTQRGYLKEHPWQNHSSKHIKSCQCTYQLFPHVKQKFHMPLILWIFQKCHQFGMCLDQSDIFYAYGISCKGGTILVHSGCYNKTPPIGWLVKTEAHFSQFWRLEV